MVCGTVDRLVSRYLHTTPEARSGNSKYLPLDLLIRWRWRLIQNMTRSNV